MIGSICILPLSFLFQISVATQSCDDCQKYNKAREAGTPSISCLVNAYRIPTGDGSQRCACCYLKTDKCIAFGGQVPAPLTVVVPDRGPAGGKRPWGAPKYIREWSLQLEREDDALMEKAKIPMRKVQDLLATVDSRVASQFLEVSSCCGDRVRELLMFMVFRYSVCRVILFRLALSTNRMHWTSSMIFSPRTLNLLPRSSGSPIFATLQ